jgi:lipopolysaccharide export system protein LptA
MTPLRFLSSRRLSALPLLVLLAFAAGVPAALRAQALSTAPQKTIVKSDRLEATNNGIEGHYLFLGHVRITGTNLEITCDRLEIFSVSTPESEEKKDDPEEDEDDVFSGAGNIRRMLATGNVTIAQTGRRAVCGQAEVLPGEDRIILTESPVLSDLASGVTMRGTRMTYNRGERNVVVENPEVVGPALPNLGFPVPEAGATETAPSQPPPTP